VGVHELIHIQNFYDFGASETHILVPLILFHREVNASDRPTVKYFGSVGFVEVVQHLLIPLLFLLILRRAAFSSNIDILLMLLLDVLIVCHLLLSAEIGANTCVHGVFKAS